MGIEIAMGSTIYTCLRSKNYNSSSSTSSTSSSRSSSSRVLEGGRGGGGIGEVHDDKSAMTDRQTGLQASDRYRRIVSRRKEEGPSSPHGNIVRVRILVGIVSLAASVPYSRRAKLERLRLPAEGSVRRPATCARGVLSIIPLLLSLSWSQWLSVLTLLLLLVLVIVIRLIAHRLVGLSALRRRLSCRSRSIVARMMIIALTLALSLTLCEPSTRPLSTGPARVLLLVFLRCWLVIGVRVPRGSLILLLLGLGGVPPITIFPRHALHVRLFIVARSTPAIGRQIVILCRRLGRRRGILMVLPLRISVVLSCSCCCSCGKGRRLLRLPLLGLLMGERS
ncbi:hypothetical protein BCV69DRAFT_39582 [Microstroma glucosiphilum]|uniref:Uncharacterized protein n=1 Tax=Pseudomicrostroma glucosiphilum TaxID=1684307 RepID=A0A316U2H4_9BASI|nr:hypothetical protein BCV69DRAFT_39582 [Pseudomicrostroma glucosiphilum]PWN19447.1 hypothetical protein BCV69DRAFT_39582 [Pseudomicrostroma glucosiphilum]